MKWLLSLLIYLFVITSGAVSQSVSDTETKVPDPKVAFLKSLVLPGLGHYYVNHSDWNRGKYHMAADAALILSYLGFSIHSHDLQHNWYSYGKAESGVAIRGRSRRFQIAVGNFDNLQAYNNYQERSRNWDKLFDDIPENRWNWSSETARTKYNDLRNRFEHIDRQLPALLVLMVVNRVISGISAYNRAQKVNEKHSVSSNLYLRPYRGNQGLVANLTFHF